MCSVLPTPVSSTEHVLCDGGGGAAQFVAAGGEGHHLGYSGDSGDCSDSDS